MRDTFRLATAVVICELAGVIGSLFTRSSIDDWYQYLERPSFAPPNWVFGPVWTLLYALMGIAAFLIWKAPQSAAQRVALTLFVVQLALNTLWSVIFFGLRNPGLALLEIIVLWVLILATIVAFARVRHAAAVLLVPYIAWVSFATILNYSFWALN
ncbi:MAG TPA: TspO/MBR family protein [Candidatus Paceibacterota bacterium]